MAQCACSTASGSRCSRTARPGSRFCQQHASCDRIAGPGNDEVYEARRLASAMRTSVAELARERDYYFKKLERIEAFASKLPAPSRRRLEALLKR